MNIHFVWRRGGTVRRAGLRATAFLSFLAAIFVSGSIWAATIYVDDNTCPAAGSGTLASPYCRIQDAICVAVSNDVVSVAPGNYPEAIRMKPGVSVTSQGGATVTTINAAGQPCTDTNFCAKRAGNQCSVVTFASGHTPTTVLDGFKLTGGAGQAPTSPVVVGGGGVFVFSSPTIRNNIITNNILAGTRREFDGGGIYVSLGAPVITNNVITGNRAVPAAGVSGATTYGYGGGIYSSFFSNPTMTDNTIQSNVAGDKTLAFHVSAGGGVMIYPPDPNHPGDIVLDRNLIADNTAGTFGGGVALSSLPNSSEQAIVSNNVIVGNTSFRGGGLYTYLNKAKIVNNTISMNTGMLGGGVFDGLSDVTLPVIVSNNSITNNILSFAGTAGGIYKSDSASPPSNTLESNDVFGNQKTQTGGDLVDSTFFASNNNYSLDPKYLNEPARDYHIDPNSPLIDRGLSSRAPPVDKDNFPRGYDGDGIPNYPMAGDKDVGAYEWHPACVPQTEICDNLDNNCNGQIDEGNPGGGVSCSTGLLGVCAAGTTACTSGTLLCNQNTMPSAEVCDNLDNNCNGQVDEGNPGGGAGCSTGLPGVCAAGTVTCQGGSLACVQSTFPTTEVCDGLDNNCNNAVDEGFIDTDFDGLADCVDPDDDNDGALDGVDCAPLNGTAFGVPTEVANVDPVTTNPTTISYTLQNIGTGTHYEIVSGLLSRILPTGGFQEDFCVAAFTGGGSWQDPRPSPPLNNGWYYFIRDVNACGSSTYGTALRDTPRSLSVCPSNIHDSDFDGSPSDLDCNDADPNISPFRPEVCDNIDNNCNSQIDEGNPGGGVICGVSNVGDCRLGSTQCSSGSVICSGAVFPTTEICDGHDNNCDTQVDEGFPDTDMDGAKDCIDPDDDNDGVLDGADCAPLDATAFGAPVEIQDLDFIEGAPPMLTWTNQAIGSGTRYQIASGQLSMAGIVNFSAGTCLPSTVSSPAPASAIPPTDTVFYYMVKPVNACGTSTYGSAARNTHPVCP